MDAFHPAVERWFRRAFPGGPTAAQLAAWPAIAAGRNTLVAAPTGSGKTLTAFLTAIDSLVREGLKSGGLPDETAIVYVSPLKALSNDIHCNLEAPLAGIRDELAALGLPDVDIRTAVRTGDTSQRERTLARRKPPHVLVTTPESLYVLLGSETGRAMLRTVRTVIVDEIHAVAASKRGSHLALSLERLEKLATAAHGRRLVRIGLSATQKPIDEIARFLVGAPAVRDGRADCEIVDIGYAKERDLALVVPPTPLSAVMSNDQWAQVYDQLAALACAHRTTLVFVNTRRMAERAARHLAERLGEVRVAAHHGSLAREKRFDAERRLKNGELQALVATASLELGLDIGDVDLVCQIGSPRSISTFLQRAGRSGHSVGGTPKARLFPGTRDELVECAALLDCVRRGELDALRIPKAPLDVLAQQLVAEVASGDCGEDELFVLVRRAWPYAKLAREDFCAVVRMLSEGFATRNGTRSTWLHRDAVNRRLRPRRGARLTALTSGGTIPDTGDYAVVLEPDALVVGTVNEDFAVESLAGDVFQLGNVSYRIRRVEPGRVRVEDVRDHRAAPAAAGVAGMAGMPAPVAYHTPAGYEELEERVPLRGLRRVIANQMVASHLHAVRTLHVDEADVTDLVALREKLKPRAAARGVKLSYLPFVMKAVATALSEYPALNSSLDDVNGEIVRKRYYNLGMAVATDAGLVVPVLRDVDQRTIMELAAEVNRLAEVAKAGKLTIEELKGGTFSITNIGSLGGLFSFPIINVPEAAILGVHSIKKRPVVLEDDSIVARQMLYLSLSFDHRLVDGAEASLFTSRVIDLLENPETMMLDL